MPVWADLLISSVEGQNWPHVSYGPGTMSYRIGDGYKGKDNPQCLQVGAEVLKENRKLMIKVD